LEGKTNKKKEHFLDSKKEKIKKIKKAQIKNALKNIHLNPSYP
jgi:hypothetical protein